MIETTTDDIVNTSSVAGATLSDALESITVGPGGLAPADRAKLDGIQSGATANSTDAQLRDRATHTGTQAISTVTGLSSAIAAKQDTLVSGTSLKTINGQSLLGAGDLVIAGGGGGGELPMFPADGWGWAVMPGGVGGKTELGGVWTTLAGSLAGPAQTSGGMRQSLPRMAFTGGAGAGNAVEGGVNRTVWRGNAAALGGFRLRMRFSVVSTIATQRGFFGLHPYGTSFGAGSAPFASSNALALAWDKAVDSNYQIVHVSSGGAQTKINLGSNFPLGNPGAVLDVQFTCAPNASAIDYTVKDLNSGAVASGTISTNLPGATVMLYTKIFLDNVSTAAAAACDVMLINGRSY